MKNSLKVYCVFDELSGALHHFCVAASDALAVRSVLSSLEVPLKDSKLYCLGKIQYDFDFASFGDESPRLNFGADVIFTPLIDPRFVTWDSYRFPETPAEALSDLKMSKSELENYINSVGKNNNR